MKPLPVILRVVIVSGALCLSVVASPAQTKPDSYFGVPVAEIAAETNALLHNWYPRIIDYEHGGYWTNFEHDWKMSDDQTKMLVTQARGLWTAARAAALFPADSVYRKAADHGYKFLTESMWDKDNAGFVQFYPQRPAPSPQPTYKLTYGNTFAVFALAEYAKINPDPAVLLWVKKSFQWLEAVAHDPVNLGYYNLILPKTLSTNDPVTRAVVARLGWGEPDWKDQNTSIHVLEALTNVYQVMPDDLVQQRLREMLKLVRDTMVDEDGFLHLFFTSDWQPISHCDSSRTYILQNLLYDHISFGHDIETAYLLLDAARVLYGRPDTTTVRVAKKLVDHTLAHGFDKNDYGLFDKGYRFAGTDQIAIVNNQKVWWSQAEAWHTLALMAERYPDEPRYAAAFRRMWSYIRNEMIDHEYGGWYNNGLDTSPQNRKLKKGHQWKGAYHNGRALIDVWIHAKNQK